MLINVAESDRNIISCGVPQGSVLGPQLFSLYINDLYMAIGSDSVRYFQMTVLFMRHTDLNELINDITDKKPIELYNWCVRNKMTINGERRTLYCFKRSTNLSHKSQNFNQIKTG